MARMPKPKPTRSARREPKKNVQKLVPVVVHLLPGQAAAIRKEATRRMRERGRGRSPDVSEVLRDAIAVWAAIRPAQRAIIRGVAERRDLTRPEVLRLALDAWLTALDPDGR
jgi:hypothetical protein